MATALRHLPKVGRAVTDGLSETGLYRRAIALSSVGRSPATLQAEISANAERLDVDAVNASLDDQAARRADRAAASATVAARVSATRYFQLKGRVESTALRLYMSGGVVQASTINLTSTDQFVWARDYLDTAVGPNGVLDARARALADAKTETSLSRAASAHARAEAAQADVLLADEQSSAARLEAQLYSLGTSNASAIAADHRALASQEAANLTSATALQFKPAKPLPAPVSTTSVALTWAFGELGKPYLWGGTGPDEFDCSGLTQYSWNKAGVVIPRVAADQDAWTDPVPLSQLLPGDLVFYGTSYIHHVGMYIGDGLMINAPHTGTVVQVSPIWWSDLAGFGRVHSAGTPTASHQLPTASHPAPRIVKVAKPVPSETKPPASGSTKPKPQPKPKVHRHKHLKIKKVKGTSGGAVTTTTAPSTTTTTTPPSTTPPSTTAPSTTTPSSTTTTTVPSTSTSSTTTTVPPSTTSGST